MPANYLLKMQKDVDSLWQSLHQSEGVFHGYIRSLSDYNTIVVPLCPELESSKRREQPCLFVVTNLLQ
jgi:hypothetical protein